MPARRASRAGPFLLQGLGAKQQGERVAIGAGPIAQPRQIGEDRRELRESHALRGRPILEVVHTEVAGERNRHVALRERARHDAFPSHPLRSPRPGFRQQRLVAEPAMPVSSPRPRSRLGRARNLEPIEASLARASRAMRAEPANAERKSRSSCSASTSHHRRSGRRSRARSSARCSGSPVASYRLRSDRSRARVADGHFIRTRPLFQDRFTRMSPRKE